jgi:hypothetical protein
MARAKRTAVLATIAVVTMNVWTGGPLFALWVGSRVQGSGPPKMEAIALAALTLGVVSFVLVRVLARLTHLYDRLTGRPSQVRQHVPWLRSMRGERPHPEGEPHRITAPDYILVGAVVIAVAVFEVWFFFFSGSPIAGSTGR